MAKATDFMLDADRELILARLENSRRRGKTFFVFFEYVLRWGGAFFVAHVAFDLLLHPSRLHGVQALYTCGEYSSYFLAGYLWGLWSWHSNEKRYRELKAL